MDQKLHLTPDGKYYIQSLIYPLTSQPIIRTKQRPKIYTLETGVKDAFAKGYISNTCPPYSIDGGTLVIEIGPSKNIDQCHLYAMKDGLIGIIAEIDPSDPIQT
jgi:hypothetical protein